MSHPWRQTRLPVRDPDHSGVDQLAQGMGPHLVLDPDLP
jgi:hypothetical protein